MRQLSPELKIKCAKGANPMRRTDREVTSFTELTDILRRADTLRLGIHGDPYPYVVPLSYGYEAAEGKITLYFHGAKEGFKHHLIKLNPNVCVEADILHRYAAIETSVTAEYESFIGFGTAELVEGSEAVKGLDLLLAHCGYEGFEYDKGVTKVTAVYKIELDSFTGKRRMLN
jgi:nitroimidazol reductase NimA-like FMN-containing flavoprotein (pyridoxamine 5'-phosphate oxidase superfamily)